MENKNRMSSNGLENTIEKIPSKDQKHFNKEVEGELSMESNAVILPLTRKESKKAVTMEEKQKKKSSDNVEVLPNRSWITNFYHNYTKAVERANLTPESATKLRNISQELNNKNKKAFTLPDQSAGHLSKSESKLSSLQSILFLKASKLKDGLFSNLKVDVAVVKAFSGMTAGEKSKAVHSTIKEKELPLTDAKQHYREVKPVFSLQDIPIKQFEKYGITQEGLLKSGMLEKLLKGEKTMPVDHLQIKNSKGEVLNYSASFFLEKKPDGTTCVKMNYLPQNPSLKVPDKIQGHLVSPAMKKQLAEKGSVPLLREPISGRVVSMLTIDTLQNTLQVKETQQRSIPMEIKGVKLSEGQQQRLKEGKEVKLSGLRAKNGTSFHATVKMDYEKNLLRFTSAYRMPKESVSLEEQPITAKSGVKPVPVLKEEEFGRKDKPLQQPKGMRR